VIKEEEGYGSQLPALHLELFKETG
jgi:hypothetical protein